MGASFQTRRQNAECLHPGPGWSLESLWLLTCPNFKVGFEYSTFEQVALRSQSFRAEYFCSCKDWIGLTELETDKSMMDGWIDILELSLTVINCSNRWTCGYYVLILDDKDMTLLLSLLFSSHTSETFSKWGRLTSDKHWQSHLSCLCLPLPSGRPGPQCCYLGIHVAYPAFEKENKNAVLADTFLAK